MSNILDWLMHDAPWTFWVFVAPELVLMIGTAVFWLGAGILIAITWPFNRTWWR